MATQTAIPFQRSATRATMPQVQNPDEPSGIVRTAVSPQAVFGAYANQRLQGSGTRSKFGRGTVFTSGPMAGQQKGAAMVSMRDDMAKAPDNVKQAAIDRASGADLMPGYKAPVASGPPPRLDTYGMGGKPDYSKLDWLKANATTGNDLKTAERNVAVTGSRDRTAGDALSQKERAISAPAFTPENLASARADQASLAAAKDWKAKNPTTPQPKPEDAVGAVSTFVDPGRNQTSGQPAPAAAPSQTIPSPTMPPAAAPAGVSQPIPAPTSSGGMPPAAPSTDANRLGWMSKGPKPIVDDGMDSEPDEDEDD